MIDKRLFVPIIALILLYMIGIFAYTHLEGWSVTDAIYFLTVTFTTIGYGDVIPHTELGKMITVFFCWSGVAIALYTFSVIASIMSQHDEVTRERIGRIRHHMTTNPFRRKKKD